MKYTEEMILQSESGYCMPFEERKPGTPLIPIRIEFPE